MTVNAERDVAFSVALDAYRSAERPPLCPKCGGWDGPRLPFCTDERWSHHLTCSRYTFGLDLCSACVTPPGKDHADD